MKIAVITANIGGFDHFNAIPKQSIDFDFFYYTEANLPFPMHTQDNRMKAKVMKICPHWALPQYDVYIWKDANILVKSPSFLADILANLKEVSISDHPFRKTIYEEADYICSEIKKRNGYLSSRYSIESIRKEIESIGPNIQGLFWCGLFARVNDSLINKCFERWFTDNVLYSNFDQLSFSKMVQECFVKVGKFDFGNFYKNDHYELTKHLR